MKINRLISKKHHFTVLLLTVCVTLWLIIEALSTPARVSAPQTNTTPILTEHRQLHLLYGDARGGGHLHGVGKPCKSEFPADWDANEIIAHVKAVAANDNLGWEQQKNGYHVAEHMVENTRMRVILSQDRSRIITAYPINVPRNPCPRNAANDP